MGNKVANIYRHGKSLSRSTNYGARVEVEKVNDVVASREGDNGVGYCVGGARTSSTAMAS